MNHGKGSKARERKSRWDALTKTADKRIVTLTKKWAQAIEARMSPAVRVKVEDIAEEALKRACGLSVANDYETVRKMSILLASDTWYYSGPFSHWARLHRYF